MIGNHLEPFKFWCQKVLPNVYDDSLSYYEYLCKLNEYLNEVIGQINTLTDNMEDYEADLTATWLETKEYIDNYFNNLDVQQEINNKLDAMAESGELSTLLSPIVGTQIGGVVADQIGATVASQIGDTVASQIDASVAGQIATPTANATNAWLAEHVNPVGSAVVVDDSFTIHGAAADSRTVGWRCMIAEQTVNAGNYSTVLPDLNTAGKNKIYHLLFANTTTLPLHCPPITKTGTNMTLITSTGTATVSVSNGDVSQIFITETEIWYRRKTGTDDNDWNDWYSLTIDKGLNVQTLTVVNASNYQSVLSDLNNAVMNRIYIMNFATNSTTLPSNYPEGASTDTLGVLVCYGTVAPTQLFYNNSSIYIRHSTGANTFTDWVRIADYKFNVKAIKQITASNYSTDLSDLNNAEENTIYTFVFALNSTTLPNNYPVASSNATISTLITLCGESSLHYSGFKTQLFYNLRGMWYRTIDTGTTWTRWIQFGNKEKYDIIIGTGQEFTSLKEGIEAATKYYGSKVFVSDGTYDLITEFGSDFFENMGSGTQQGINLKNGISIVFSSNSKVVCNYQGDNENVLSYFSPFYFGDGTDIYIEGLNLESNNTRYGIHDELANNAFTSTHTYINCSIKHDSTNTWYLQAIGGGLGKSTTIIIRDSYFKSSSPTNGGTVSWHNSSNSSAKGSIVITGCYFDSSRNDGEGGNFRFGYYGSSSSVTPIKLSNCSMKNNAVMRYETSDTSTPQNAELLAYNNTIRTT